MKRMKMRAAVGLMAVLGAISLAGMVGCGMPAAPQPPSLDLPNPVVDLTAVRHGGQVALHWTNPKRTTDKVLLTAMLAVRVCRDADCAMRQVAAEPGKPSEFTDTLPLSQQQGAARALKYTVELPNKLNRVAGPSNVVTVLAGAAPQAVTGLAAEPTRTGIVLRWTPTDGQNAAIRLHRTLIAPKKNEIAARELLVAAAEHDPGRALDQSAERGREYRYSAERVIFANKLELASSTSEPITVAFTDTFAPIAPTALAAVESRTAEHHAAIDLSWQPVAEPATEPQVAGYIVYRRVAEGAWQRLNESPVAAPYYEDATVTEGVRYEYAVAAVGVNHQESARSQSASETVAAP